MTLWKINKIIGLSEHWQCFLASVLLLMVFPLTPLGAQWALNQGIITTETVLVTASVYSISMGAASRNLSIFVLALIAGVTYAFAYGASSGSQNEVPGIRLVVTIGLVALFAFTFCERFNRHVIERERFPEFMSKEKK